MFKQPLGKSRAQESVTNNRRQLPSRLGKYEGASNQAWCKSVLCFIWQLRYRSCCGILSDNWLVRFTDQAYSSIERPIDGGDKREAEPCHALSSTLWAFQPPFFTIINNMLTPNTT